MPTAYFHGFASSPQARKGLALRERLERYGVALQLPDLNQPSFEALTYEAILAHLDALAEAFGDEPWDIIGSSMGGYIAARWAELRPERVRGLLLLCPGFDMHSRWPAIFGEAALARWERDGQLPVADGAGVERPLHWGLVTSARAQPAFPALHGPATIIHGRGDETVPIASSRAYAAQHDGWVRLVEVEDDHSLMASLDVIEAEAVRLFGLEGEAPGEVG